VATDAQFQIDRAKRQLHLVIGTPEAASLPTQVAMRLGPEGSSPLIIAGLLQSLSVFDALEANETSLRSSGYSFAIRLVDPRNADLVRTAFGKVPLVVDRI
ncbi:UNVERIFIED_ORG: hypothetical protein J2R82_009126, partial [Bradyrhizobium japonicum]